LEALENRSAIRIGSIIGDLGGQSQESQQEGRQQGLLSSNLNRAIGAGVRARSGPVAGGLNDVGIRCTINERSTTIGLHVGGDITSTEDRWETVFGDVVNLLNARSTKVDALEGAVLAGSDGGDDLKDFVESQSTGNGLDIGKSLGYAELVLIRSIGKTDPLSNGGVSLLYDGGNGGGLGVADDGLQIRGTASGHVGDDIGQIIVGARTVRAETLQPSIDGSNCGAAGPLQENLEKTARVETRGTRGSSDSNEGTLALSGNPTDLSKGTTDSGSNKK